MEFLSSDEGNLSSFFPLRCNSISNSLEYFVNFMNLTGKVSEMLSINHALNHLWGFWVFKHHYCQFQTELYLLRLGRGSKITLILFQEMLTSRSELSNAGPIFQGVSRWTPEESGTRPGDVTKIDSLAFKFTTSLDDVICSCFKSSWYKVDC